MGAVAFPKTSDGVQLRRGTVLVKGEDQPVEHRHKIQARSVWQPKRTSKGLAAQNIEKLLDGEAEEITRKASATITSRR
jgi:hypothetical protein